MSQVVINNVTYDDVIVRVEENTDPSTLEFTMAKGERDLDRVATDFSCGQHEITVGETVYKGYTVFVSISTDLTSIVIVLSQKSVKDQLEDTYNQIAELQDATASIIEMMDF